ncbi:hypothetical protein [Maledivibacter halophilus]|uniref:Uncharacterized protein n=1 Tax=Maledivibacter halophilus TaxID=36842 RepID=A0A1T5KYK4_9FIRM|nr:hypothetical protein [Maledivibacter halophilus]SKC68761.1 hypothetical protein SAMN02194393_02184 [Maledivibacter halophilus]
MYIKNKNDIVKILIVICIGILLLKLIGNFIVKIEIASNRIEISDYDKYKLIIAFLFTLFGVLIEWREIIRIITKGFCFRWSYLIASVILIIFPMIPWQIMLNIFELKAAFYLSAYIRTALSILGGILLVRSFRKRADER